MRTTKLRFTCPNDIVTTYWKLHHMLPEDLRNAKKLVAIGRTSMILHRVGGSIDVAEFAVSATANEYLKHKTLPEGVVLRVGLPFCMAKDDQYFVPSEDLKAIHSQNQIRWKNSDDVLARCNVTDIERFWEREKPPVSVEKVKGWEEGSLSEAEVVFEKMCQEHDWYYQYSDSITVQNNGDASWERLQVVRKKLGDRGDMIFNFYTK